MELHDRLGRAEEEEAASSALVSKYGKYCCICVLALVQ